MIKRKILISTGVFVAAVLSLYILIMAAPKPNSSLNGFTRNFNKKPITLIKELKVELKVSKTCGATVDSFYFIGKDPRVIYRSDWDLEAVDSSFIPFGLSKSVLSNFQLFSNPPHTYLYAGNYAKIQYYTYGEEKVRTIDVAAPLFTQAILLPSGNAILKGFNERRDKQLIQKIDFSTGRITRDLNLFGEQEDGGFSRDGLLTYSNVDHLLVYTHYYENKFYCLDTNLHVIYTGKTIDTTEHNKVSTRSFSKENKPGSLMPSVPLNQINKECIVSNGVIYVHSTLKADNETSDSFLEHTSIDCYNLRNGTYNGSFYVPNMNGERMKKMLIHLERLVAIYPNGMAIFKITQ